MKMVDMQNNYDGIWWNFGEFGVNCGIEENDLADSYGDFNNKLSVILTNPVGMMDI